jgi:hypothetical protein
MNSCLRKNRPRHSNNKPTLFPAFSLPPVIAAYEAAARDQKDSDALQAGKEVELKANKERAGFHPQSSRCYCAGPAELDNPSHFNYYYRLTKFI